MKMKELETLLKTQDQTINCLIDVGRQTLQYIDEQRARSCEQTFQRQFNSFQVDQKASRHGTYQNSFSLFPNFSRLKSYAQQKLRQSASSSVFGLRNGMDKGCIPQSLGDVSGPQPASSLRNAELKSIDPNILTFAEPQNQLGRNVPQPFYDPMSGNFSMETSSQQRFTVNNMELKQIGGR